MRMQSSPLCTVLTGDHMDYDILQLNLQPVHQHRSHNLYATAQLPQFASHLSSLHLLRPSAEGHVRVAGARAIPLFLLDSGDEGATLAAFPLAAPVVKHLLDQLVVLLQQQFGFLETDKLESNTKRAEISSLIGATAVC